MGVKHSSMRTREEGERKARGRREEDIGGRKVECHEGQPNWRKMIELPIFEGLDPLN